MKFLIFSIALILGGCAFSIGGPRDNPVGPKVDLCGCDNAAKLTSFTEQRVELYKICMQTCRDIKGCQPTEVPR